MEIVTKLLSVRILDGPVRHLDGPGCFYLLWLVIDDVMKGVRLPRLYFFFSRKASFYGKYLWSILSPLP